MKKPWFILPVLHADYPVRKKAVVDPTDKEVQAECWFPTKEEIKREINVRSSLTPDQMRAALWHEFFHALFHEYGDQPGCENESKVEAFAQAVMRVRRDVPWL